MTSAAPSPGQPGHEVGAVDPDQLAKAVVELIRSWMYTSPASAPLEGTEILLTIDDVHEQWRQSEWDVVRSLCHDGVEICSIWKANAFSYVPVLAQGILYVYWGSCTLLGKRAEGWGLEAVHVFRNGRECLRNLMHMDSNAFEATACLGLATAYYVCSNYELAASASSNGLTLLPNNTHGSYRTNPDPQPSTTPPHKASFSAMASNTQKLRRFLKDLHDWARIKRQL